MNTIMRQNDVCYVRKCNPVVLSPVSLACVCRASSGVTHRYTQPAYTTGALKLSGLHTVTHWSEWLQTLDPQYWTKIRILPTVSVYFALNFTFRLVPHALPQCTAPVQWQPSGPGDHPLSITDTILIWHCQQYNKTIWIFIQYFYQPFLAPVLLRPGSGPIYQITSWSK